MFTQRITVVVLRADSLDGARWLRDMFPSAPRQHQGVLVRRPGAEIDAVVWAEELRFDAKRAGVRLCIGIAEHHESIRLRDVIAAASLAAGRARELGGDITIAHSALLRAA